MERFCWWQMEDQEVWPLGRPGRLYSGRCCNTQQEKRAGSPNGRHPCFFKKGTAPDCLGYTRWPIEEEPNEQANE